MSTVEKLARETRVPLSRCRDWACARGGILDIPFLRTIRDALLDEGLAERDHRVPGSGWITFSIRTGHDLDDALWLARLSHGRYVLRTSKDPNQALTRLSDELRLSSRFKSLLEPFLPRSSKTITI